MSETIHEMSRKMMGITAVVDGDGRLLGVISDGDLRRLLEKDPTLLSRRAGDCLHAEPEDDRRRGVRLDGARKDAARTRSPRSSSWTAEGRLTGAIHLHDLLSAGIS